MNEDVPGLSYDNVVEWGIPLAKPSKPDLDYHDGRANVR